MLFVASGITWGTMPVDAPIPAVTRMARLLDLRLSLRQLTPLLALALAGGYFLRHSLDGPILDEADTVELRHVIRSVKQQLYQADVDARQRGETHLFKLKDFVFEANTVVGRSDGTDLKVLSIGSNTSINQQKVQKITIRWEAIDVPAVEEVVGPSAGNLAQPDVVVRD